MTKKQQAELTKVAEKIYDLAADEMQKYLNKKYANKPDATMTEQLNDLHVISDEVAAYLMGNIIGLEDKSCWEADIKELNGHIRQVAEYVNSNQRAQLGPKQ
ncbi:MAG: hypothetical protein IJ153_05740 [Clostridia bacterium]|nr:hypothetical protein [Clostridia bacterium]